MMVPTFSRILKPITTKTEEEITDFQCFVPGIPSEPAPKLDFGPFLTRREHRFEESICAREANHWFGGLSGPPPESPAGHRATNRQWQDLNSKRKRNSLRGSPT